MHQILDLNSKQLRNFGLLIGTIIVVLFGLLLPLLKRHPLPSWPWIVATILWCLAFLAPMALQPIYRAWMRFGMILGWVETRIILGLVFYGLLTPMGIFMRLLKHNPLQMHFELSSESYRTPGRDKPLRHMEKPY